MLKEAKKGQREALISNMFYYKQLKKGDKYEITRKGQTFNIYLQNFKMILPAESGQKICLMGDEFSGRRSFIEGLLGESYKLLGKKIITGSIAYLTYNEDLLVEGKTI